MTDTSAWERRHKRERLARKQAEAILEEKSLELYRANQLLTKARDELEMRVLERTRELEAVNRELTEQRECAIAANRAKSEFLANMSHEIRTPMTAILGYTEMILDDEVTEAERLSSIETIQRNGEHLLHIINDILDISKLEAGHLEVERIPVRIAELIGDVHRLMSVRAKEKSIELVSGLDGEIPQEIQTDPTRLRQILVNIIGNAIKFTAEGQVEVRARFLANYGSRDLQVDVIDQGIGMTEEQADRVFEAFHQADTTTTRKYGGTGLGLSISRRLARMLGGDISCKAKLGVGCCFTVTVETGDVEGVPMTGKLEEATTRETVVTQQTPVRLDGARILLAEDGRDNQLLVSHILKKVGAKVTIAGDGEEASRNALEARASGDDYHVILMDMQMPVMDGYQATRLLRDRGYEGPIIALTANAMSTDRDKCLRAGCTEFETKPLDRLRLCHKIHDLLPPDVQAGSTPA